MKREIGYKIVLLIIGVALFISCEKIPFDYRNKYLGKWYFKVDRSEFNTDSIGHFEHDSLTYMGKIKYGSAGDKLLIQYTQDNSVTLSVDRDGVISDFPTHYCSGEFEGKKKIHLYLRWGGLGGGITHVVDGEKK